jgi:hypothetical protein
MIPDYGLLINSAVKAGIIIIFPVIPAVFGFYEKIEIETLRKIIRKTKNPIELIKSIAELKKER